MPPATARCRASVLVAGVLLVFAGAAQARPERDLARVDLSVRAGDFKLSSPLRPVVPFVPAAPETELDGDPVYALSDQVEATDRVRRGEIPDRRRLQNGLGIGPDGGFLEQLLEDQTIPLFRVTVEPPF